MGRCPIETTTNSFRMDSTQTGVPQNSSPFRPSDNRSNGNPPECQDPEIRLPICPSQGSNDRHLSDRPEGSEQRVCLSTPTSDFEGFELSEVSKSTRCGDRLKRAIKNMVQPPSEHVSPIHTHSPTALPVGGQPPVRGLLKMVLSSSRTQFLKHLRTQQYGHSVAERLEKAYRPSTVRQQEVVWRKFQTWLKNNPTTQLSLAVVLQFLENQFNSNLSPRTVLSYRAALALPLKLGFDIDIKDNVFSLLARAHFLSRPPTKRLVPQWDLNSVLSLLSQPNFDTLSASLEDLLNKTLFLVALATGSRASELGALYRPALSFRNGKKEVLIPVRPGFLYKNQSQQRAPPNIHIKELQLNGISHHLCPVANLHRYMALSKGPNVGDAVFLHPSTSCNLQKTSISSRLCALIEKACPGVIPRAHDVRKQAASLAWCRGTEPAEIIRSGFWSSSNVFISHYLNNTLFETVPCRTLANS